MPNTPAELRAKIAALEAVEKACFDSGETGLYLLDPSAIDTPLEEYRAQLAAAQPESTVAPVCAEDSDRSLCLTFIQMEVYQLARQF